MNKNLNFLFCRIAIVFVKAQKPKIANNQNEKLNLTF